MCWLILTILALGMLRQKDGSKCKDSLGFKVPGQEDTILKTNRADKLAQQVKVPASQPDGLNSTPRSHTAQEEQQLLQVVLRLPHVHSGMPLPQIYKNICQKQSKG